MSEGRQILRWWEVTARHYAWALVAAETAEEAVSIAQASEDAYLDWFFAEPAHHPTPPAPPAAKGFYFCVAE